MRREDRVCKEGGSGEVEHVVLRCEYVAEERERMERLRERKDGMRWGAMKRW